MPPDVAALETTQEPQNVSLETLLSHLVPDEEDGKSGQPGTPAADAPKEPAEPGAPKPGDGQPAAAAQGEDLLEWEDDKGQKQQVPIAEALAALAERTELSKTVAQLKQREALLPLELEQALLEQSRARQQLLMEAQQIQAYYVPQPPPRTMLDRASPEHDPDRYYAALQDYENGVKWLEQVKAREGQQKQILAQEQQQVRKAVEARGRHQLQQMWPEVLTDREVQSDLAGLLQHVGFDPMTALNEVTDPRAYLVMRYALQGLRAETQAKQQVKAVKTTPRLVRSAGKTSPSSQGNGELLARFQKSGSLEDAVNSLLSRQG